MYVNSTHKTSTYKTIVVAFIVVITIYFSECKKSILIKFHILLHIYIEKAKHVSLIPPAKISHRLRGIHVAKIT